jgi:hypothetical protein
MVLVLDGVPLQLACQEHAASERPMKWAVLHVHPQFAQLLGSVFFVVDCSRFGIRCHGSVLHSERRVHERVENPDMAWGLRGTERGSRARLHSSRTPAAGRGAQCFVRESYVRHQ